ncbi:hypothetical protein H696_06239 [Fonticula alba]|uniref:Uncharacterized protein n=1 Tax=Fonticula alba TaxID=691883 RepID=A0A058YZA5_FONAL|nr:hypothetical protein H696_06239 [Fonticula alba]KCV67330.1 hypothetical protein H696_06239 [Fonticula alba]|eukprot:XP_009498262.1 hypothetical protein H696_06239 [Fonticula alba]
MVLPLKSSKGDSGSTIAPENDITRSRPKDRKKSSKPDRQEPQRQKGDLDVRKRRKEKQATKLAATNNAASSTLSAVPVASSTTAPAVADLQDLPENSIDASRGAKRLRRKERKAHAAALAAAEVAVTEAAAATKVATDHAQPSKKDKRDKKHKDHMNQQQKDNRKASTSAGGLSASSLAELARQPASSATGGASGARDRTFSMPLANSLGSSLARTPLRAFSAVSASSPAPVQSSSRQKLPSPESSPTELGPSVISKQHMLTSLGAESKKRSSTASPGPSDVPRKSSKLDESAAAAAAAAVNVLSATTPLLETEDDSGHETADETTETLDGTVATNSPSASASFGITTSPIIEQGLADCDVPGVQAGTMGEEAGRKDHTTDAEMEADEANEEDEEDEEDEDEEDDDEEDSTDEDEDEGTPPPFVLGDQLADPTFDAMLQMESQPTGNGAFFASLGTVPSFFSGLLPTSSSSSSAPGPTSTTPPLSAASIAGTSSAAPASSLGSLSGVTPLPMFGNLSGTTDEIESKTSGVAANKTGVESMSMARTEPLIEASPCGPASEPESKSVPTLVTAVEKSISTFTTEAAPASEIVSEPAPEPMAVDPSTPRMKAASPAPGALSASSRDASFPVRILLAGRRFILPVRPSWPVAQVAKVAAEVYLSMYVRSGCPHPPPSVPALRDLSAESLQTVYDVVLAISEDRAPAFVQCVDTSSSLSLGNLDALDISAGFDLPAAELIGDLVDKYMSLQVFADYGTITPEVDTKKRRASDAQALEDETSATKRTRTCGAEGKSPFNSGPNSLVNPDSNPATDADLDLLINLNRASHSSDTVIPPAQGSFPEKSLPLSPSLALIPNVEEAMALVLALKQETDKAATRALEAENRRRQIEQEIDALRQRMQGSTDGARGATPEAVAGGPAATASIPPGVSDPAPAGPAITTANVEVGQDAAQSSVYSQPIPSQSPSPLHAQTNVLGQDSRAAQPRVLVGANRTRTTKPTVDETDSDSDHEPKGSGRDTRRPASSSTPALQGSTPAAPVAHSNSGTPTGLLSTLIQNAGAKSFTSSSASPVGGILNLGQTSPSPTEGPAGAKSPSLLQETSPPILKRPSVSPVSGSKAVPLVPARLVAPTTSVPPQGGA